MNKARRASCSPGLLSLAGLGRRLRTALCSHPVSSLPSRPLPANFAHPHHSGTPSGGARMADAGTSAEAQSSSRDQAFRRRFQRPTAKLGPGCCAGEKGETVGLGLSDPRPKPVRRVTFARFPGSGRTRTPPKVMAGRDPAVQGRARDLRKTIARLRPAP
jgi:hypothetical protein